MQEMYRKIKMPFGFPKSLFNLFARYPFPSSELRSAYILKFFKNSLINYQRFLFLCLAVTVLRGISCAYNFIHGSNTTPISGSYIIMICLNSSVFFYIRSVFQSLDEKKPDQIYSKCLNCIRGISVFLSILIWATVFINSQYSDTDSLIFQWVSCLFGQIYVCIWLTKEMAMKLAILVVYNGVFILTYPKERPNFLIVTLFITICCATLFFDAFQANQIENFLFKKFLKGQNKVYKQFIDKIDDPVIIFESCGILSQNSASLHKTKIDPTKI